MPTLIDTEIRCPLCKVRVSVYQRSCPGCGADVSLLADLHLLPYALFNAGLELYTQGDFPAALVKFAAAVESKPDLHDAHRMLARTAESLSTRELAERHRRLGEKES